MIEGIEGRILPMSSGDIVIITTGTDTLGNIGLNGLNGGEGFESRHDVRNSRDWKNWKKKLDSKRNHKEKRGSVGKAL